jgi:hypothetical protein
MKRMKIANTVLFFLLVAALAYASPRQQDEPKSKEASPAMQHPEGKPEAKPESQEQKPDEMKPEKNGQEKPDKDAGKQEEKENKDRDKQEKKDEKRDDKKSGKDMDKMRNDNMRNDNHGNEHPAGKGGHIPDDKFRSSFGRSHSFHPSRPTVVGGRPTFVYGGYSFILVDAWPAEWAYTDDCYIDYVDGEYFLFDLLHPGVRIALFVSM